MNGYVSQEYATYNHQPTCKALIYVGIEPNLIHPLREAAPSRLQPWPTFWLTPPMALPLQGLQFWYSHDLHSDWLLPWPRPFRAYNSDTAMTSILTDPSHGPASSGLTILIQPWPTYQSPHLTDPSHGPAPSGLTGATYSVLAVSWVRRGRWVWTSRVGGGVVISLCFLGTAAAALDCELFFLQKRNTVATTRMMLSLQQTQLK